MNLKDTLNQIHGGKPVETVTLPENWLQGRTCYGGLSTALAYQAAKMSDADLPPLNSAQIAFAGPLSGDVDVSASILRRGRNTAFVKSEISCNGSVGLSCSFIFMNSRDSHVDYSNVDKPEFKDWPTEKTIRTGPPEFFTQNMQYVGKRLELGRNNPRLSGWQRLIDRDGLDPIAELLCIGDALPPSAMGLMTDKGMVSSMNWQLNMLTDTPSTKDGWWHLDSLTHHAAEGSSSQFMNVCSADGTPVMTGMQSVAIFS